MSSYVEYRVRPVVRYTVSKYHSLDGGDCGCQAYGEFGNLDMASEVAIKMAEHDEGALAESDVEVRGPLLLKPKEWAVDELAREFAAQWCRDEDNPAVREYLEDLLISAHENGRCGGSWTRPPQSEGSG